MQRPSRWISSRRSGRCCRSPSLRRTQQRSCHELVSHSRCSNHETVAPRVHLDMPTSSQEDGLASATRLIVLTCSLLASPMEIANLSRSCQHGDAGSWVKLRNIGVVVVSGQLQGIFTDKSKWMACSMEPALERDVVERCRNNVVAGAFRRLATAGA